MTPGRILSVYVVLTLLSTFASSFIWGINTLFLLDAGLSITQAFAANAFFTAGEVIFEVPTGVVADTWGRRASYLLGVATLLASTLLYLAMWRIQGPFWGWALSSALLGLGFTFFSGATEAWLVDGLNATRYGGTLESAFARGQIATGAGMLTGTIAGGVIAQVTNLGVPYVLRAAILGLTFIVAFVWMRDVGFTPRRTRSVVGEVRSVLGASLDQGLRNPPVRWVMLAGVFSSGVPIYGFYAMQPYLLELYGRSDYTIAGLSAALVAAAQIAGAFVVPWARRVFRRRTSALLCGSVASACALLTMGLSSSFWIVLVVLAVWALVFAAARPIRQAFLNELIPSAQRATVLSSDNMIGSVGGAAAQPALGRVADGGGYSTSYVAPAAVELLAWPFLLRARRERAPSDPIRGARSTGSAEPGALAHGGAARPTARS
ncbi:MAG: MFS transporter [Anaeromyxobacter sp. RBG_16_69_14]|nr:MAG: MFS transporter [Anaeromyxobacter sp. RBG_16_69_14]